MPSIKDLLISLPILGFIVWVFFAPLPQERISRACEPIDWLGNLTTSATVLSSESHAATAVKWSDKLSYSCEYMIWRLLYQDDYNKAVAAGLVPTVVPEPTETNVTVTGSGTDADVPRKASDTAVQPTKKEAFPVTQ